MSKGRVLIVDDEVDVVELLSFRLRMRGCEVLKAYDGEEGLQLAKKENPDLILLDIKLPKRDGVEVCRALKSDPRYQRIPVVLISASSAQIHGQKEVGMADGFLKKPFEPEELFSIIDPYLKAA